jgi:flagellar biosynthesis chaperone FliJ
MSNEAYNVISALQAKLEGLEAYRKYAQSDGNQQLWQQLTSLDTQAVNMLVDQLEQLAQKGQLRTRQPGQTT